ncbi:hypothetical protein MRBLMR1_001166 [Neorhizobium sp. LMR1-1-1.1]|jgi:hypothetical protein
MRKNQIAFDNWWSCLAPEEQAALDKVAARKLFNAGFRYGVDTNKRKFVFMIGRRRITVTASSREAAKRMAEQAFKKRMAAAGKPLPAVGWTAQLASEEATAR